nr:DEAD/DEAH box helicase family protein [Streptococcus pneumoniae]
MVEAKDNKHSVRAGLQQAIEYGEILDVPFVYSSNGDGFIEHDRITREERELELDEFPTREELFSRMTKEKGLTYEITEAISTPYYTDAFSMKTPRYYQQIAINRTIETVARGQKRVMFVMATGTGKTFMAFQIIHRLRKAGLAKRVLFLADRNILVDQTMAEDFRPFEKVMTKITPKLLTAPEKLNSFEIYLGLYQQLTGEDGTETHYQKFDKDFFDLIVIDEAHRGSAKEDSNWRKVIDYFSSATQIGMTATPKETKNASNTEYFGEPIYTYSLKQGIEDGFLAPYRVMRVNLDVDVDGYRPETGKVDANGQLIEDRYYGRKDFDKTIVIDDRTQRVAKFVSDYMKQNNARFDKTIVFCVDIDHAERMRAALVKENLDLVQEDYRYVMQVTGDNAEGKAQLDNFMDVNSNFPAIVTTSKLLTTGVNAKTCRLIVLDSNIQSMTEFKQIIGRGTRLYPQKGKEFFTIIDFRNVTNLFADPDFDGDPVKVLETGAKTVSGSTPGFVDEFNLHTIIRLPHSVFAPYTGIHTNILFFDKTKKTEETWFYRLDMPDGYKNFSKTKPMKSEHFNPVRDWWENREEILEGKFYKSKSFTPSELAELNYNLDQCGFPKEEEEILNPFELIQNYQAERATLNHKIDNVLADILQLLEDK